MSENATKVYNVFKYLLRGGSVYKDVMRYRFYNIFDDNLIFIKNGNRCEMVLSDFYRICMDINDDYYESIIFDYNQTTDVNYKIKNAISRKVFLNSIILLFLRNKFYGVDMSMTVNNMFDNYLNLSRTDRKKLINHLRGIIK